MRSLLVLACMLPTSVAFAEHEVLIKSGATVTYPRDDWSTKKEPRLRLGLEYRAVTSSENFLSGLYGIELAHQKLPVDWADKPYDEYNLTFKLGLCFGYSIKLCPTIGTAQHYINGDDNWYNHWGIHTSLNIVASPDDMPWLVSGFEVSKRYSTYRQNKVSVRWSKVDFSALVGVKF